MSRKKRPRVMGRPVLLNPEREKQLVEASRAGVPADIAAQHAGIGRTTFLDWCRRGRDEEAIREEGGAHDPDEQAYYELWQKVVQARATAATRSVLLIQKVAGGGQVTEETTRRYRDPDNGSWVEENTVKRTAPEWRAAAWMLERQHRGHFGKEATLTIDGTGGEPMAAGAGIDADALAKKLTANLLALTVGITAAPDLTGIVEDEPVDAEVVE